MSLNLHLFITNFRANLPKEVMGFPDFPIPEKNDSFLPQENVLDFLNLYADHFNLKPLIKVSFLVQSQSKVILSTLRL